MIFSGSAVQTKGFGSSLVSRRKRLIAAWRSTIEQNTPRLRRRLVSLAKKPSTALSPGGRGRRVVEHKARMPAEPGPRLGMFVRAVIVEDHVNDLADWDLDLDGIQEPDELLMPVTLHAASDHLAVEHVERGEQRGGAVPLVIMGIVPQRPGLIGKPGWVRSSACIWLFSSTLSTIACAGGSIYSPTMSRSLGMNSGSRDSLNCRTRCGWSPCERQMRCTEETLIRTNPAIAAAVQCVVSPGGSLCGSATPRSPMAGGSGGTREGRVLSCNRPSTPVCMNRSCQRHRQVLLLAVCRMISLVPRPSAVNSTIRARHTCFWGLFRSATIASRRARSAAFTSTVIPVRIPQIRMTATTRESSLGLFRQILSTRCLVPGFDGALFSPARRDALWAKAIY